VLLCPELGEEGVKKQSASMGKSVNTGSTPHPDYSVTSSCSILMNKEGSAILGTERQAKAPGEQNPPLQE
jgi:hypothetical protein